MVFSKVNFRGLALGLVLLLLLLSPNVLYAFRHTLLADANCVLIDHLGCPVAGAAYPKIFHTNGWPWLGAGFLAGMRSSRA